MSTKNDTPISKPLALAILLSLLALIITTGLLLQEYGPGNMGLGLLVGGGVTILALGIALWRLTYRPASTTTLERAWTQHGDERDDAVLTRALAVVGLSAPLLTAAATIVIALDGPLLPTLAILNFAFIAVFAITFAWVNKRS